MKKFKKIINYPKNHSGGETFDWITNNIKRRFNKLKKNNVNFNDIKLNKKNIKSMILKQNHNVFIFGNIPYYDIGGGQRSSQMAKTFNKMGYPVYYIYGFESGEQKIHRIPMPLNLHNYIKNISIYILQEIIRENDLFIFEAPVKDYLPYVHLAKTKKAKIIYENIDNWETSLGKNIFHRTTLNELIINADLLVGSAKPLVEQLENYCKELNVSKKILYLANAVDDELFTPTKTYIKPVDLHIGKKTLIYYGSLWGEWFDWEIIFDIANKNPLYQINLIGDCSNIKNIVKKSPKNIHYLGLKKQTELPAYLKYTDYSLVPFKPGEIGNYVSPLKIFEYISMNTAVLTTKLPDIENYPNTYYGNNAELWNKILKEDISVDTKLAENFIANNNWTSRVSELILNIFSNTTCENQFFKNISIVVLNYNNSNIIEKCIDSLLRYNNRYLYEIIVVDNTSTDDSYDKIIKKYKNNIKIIQNNKNGCSSGRNLGVKNAKGDYILFLDSDQWAMHDFWLEPYFEILNNVKNVGLIGWAAGWFNKYGKSYNTVDNFPYRSMPSSCLARCDIGYLGSGGMMIKKTLFDKIGGFDTKYDPTCFEDTDISLNVRNHGYEIYYCPYLGIMHLPHQTTNDGSPEHMKLNNEKQEYFLKKWQKMNPELLKYIK